MIRAYNKKDKDNVVKFHERILRETGAYLPGPWDNDLQNIEDVYICPGGCFILVEENDTIQAMGALRIVSEEVAEIKRMRVETSLQRQGLGQKVFDVLLQHAKRHGIKRIILDTSELQVAAQQFYQKNGFTEYKKGTWNDITIIFYEMFL